jgi:hypothetical protein
MDSTNFYAELNPFTAFSEARPALNNGQTNAEIVMAVVAIPWLPNH